MEENTGRQKSKLYKQDEVQDVDDPIHFTETEQSNGNGEINNGAMDLKPLGENCDSGNEQPAGGGGTVPNSKSRSTNNRSKQLKNWRSSQGNGNSFNSNSSSSLSRDSSYEAYTDTTGANMEQFLHDMLNNKSPSDRNSMLKIEKDLIEFVNRPNEHKYTFGEMDSYHRMMVHRIAAYFGMEHNVDHSGRSIIVNKTKNTRIPEPFATKIVKHPEPQKSILKRDSGSLDEKEYRSSDLRNLADSRRSKSFEEREEEYKRTRARIFNQDERLIDPSIISGPVALYGRASDGSTVLIGSSRLNSQEDVRWTMLEPRPWSSTDSDSSGRPIPMPIKALCTDLPIDNMVHPIPMVNGRPQITKSHSDCHENLSVDHASRMPVTKSNSFSSVSYLQVEPSNSVHHPVETVLSNSANSVVQNASSFHALSRQTSSQTSLNQPVPAQVTQAIATPVANIKHHQPVNNIVPNSVVSCQDQTTASQYSAFKASNQNVEAGCQTTPIDNSYQRQQFVVPGMESVPTGFPYCNPDGSYYVHNPAVKPIICQPPPSHNSTTARDMPNYPPATHQLPLPHCSIPPPSVPPHQSQFIYYQEQPAAPLQQDSTPNEDLTQRMSMISFAQSQPMTALPDGGAGGDSIQQPVAVSTPVNGVTFSYVSQQQQPMCMLQPSGAPPAAAHALQMPNSGQLTGYPSQPQMQCNNQHTSHVYYSQALPLHNQVQHVPPPSNQYASYGYSQVHQPESINYNLTSSSQVTYPPQLVQSVAKPVTSSHLQYGYNPQINPVLQGVQSTRPQQNITPMAQFQLNQPQQYGSTVPQLSQVQPGGLQPRQLIHCSSLGANGNIYQHPPHPITPSTTPSPHFQPQSFANEYAVVGAPMHHRPKYSNHSPARPHMPFNRSVINRFGSQQWVQPLPQILAAQGRPNNIRGKRNTRRNDSSNNNSNTSSNRSSQNQTPTGRNNILEVQGYPNGIKQSDLEQYLEEVITHGGKLQYIPSDGAKNSAILNSDSINSTKYKVLAAFESETTAQSALLNIKTSKFQLRTFHPFP